MKIGIVGLGSMGKRRLRLMKSIRSSYEIVGVDTNSKRRQDVESEYKIKMYGDLDVMLAEESPDAIVVCSAPLTHSKIILKCLKKNIHVFTELNLVSDDYSEMISIAENNNCILFMSSTMLYREEINWIVNKIQSSSDKTNYRYHVGQYLPDWHPWENYKDFFVGDKRSNGCRELFAVELPWIIKAFGKISEMHVVKDKISNLDLDYPDSYIVTLTHESGHSGTLHIDVVSRKPVRNLEVYSQSQHIFWNGTPESLEEYCVSTNKLNTINLYTSVIKDKNYSDNILENAYVDELDMFFNKISDPSVVEKYTFTDDLYVLDRIDEIEDI